MEHVPACLILMQMDNMGIMLIPARHNCCIWCNRPFAIRGLHAQANCVQRSKEHIIPASLFGGIVIEDVCKTCNDQLGHKIDCRLLNDGYIVRAGQVGGFKTEQLLREFRVCGKTNKEEPFTYTVKDGKWRLEPSFSSKGFKIGSVNGQVNEQDLKNAKRQMLVQVMASTKLPEKVAKAEIEYLFSEFHAQFGKNTVLRPQIGQGLRGHPITARGKATFVTHPWETQWGIAKMAYETACTFLPDSLSRKVHTAFTQLREFVQARKVKYGPFIHRRLKVKAEPCHAIEIKVSSSKIIFFCSFVQPRRMEIEF